MIQAGSGLIYPALRKAGVTLAPGRLPSGPQMDDALEELKRLISSLGIDPLFVYHQESAIYPLQSGKGSYTIGRDSTGAAIADFDKPRPSNITEAAVVIDGVRYGLAIATPQMWAGLDLVSQPGFPEMLYNDGASPLSTLALWPAPYVSMDLELYVWHQAAALVSVNDAVQMPPGYEDAVVLNLAVRLAPQFQRPLDPGLRADARESLMRVLSLNAPRPVLSLSGLGCSGGGFDIYRG